jgi:PKD repeat protein
MSRRAIGAVSVLTTIWLALSTTLSFLAYPQEASAQRIDWIFQFGASGDDWGFDVAADAEGDTYVVGRVAGVLPGQSSSGSTDAFVRKLDGDSNVLWTRQFGTSGGGWASAVDINSSGELIVSGNTMGVLAGDASSGYLDVFVRSYDLDGKVLWTRQFGSSGSDYSEDVKTHDGYIFVGGTAQGALPGQSYYGKNDAFVSKRDSGGAEVWTRQFGTSENDDIAGIAFDTLGNVYVVGTTKGNLGWPPLGEPGAFIRKYAPNGGLLWTRQFEISGTYGHAVVVQGDDEIYLVGVIYDLVGPTDAVMVRKYDSSGEEIWTRQLIGPSYRVAATGDEAGNLYVAGTVVHTLPTQAPEGHEDFFVYSLDANGNVLWVRQSGTTAYDMAEGISADGHGNVYVIGETRGVFSGYSSAGGQDVFVARLPQQSTLPPKGTPGILETVAGVYRHVFGGDGGLAIEAFVSPDMIDIDAQGNVYIADSRYNRIRKVDTNGYIRTVAGNGIAGFSGDGGLATSASMRLDTYNQRSGVAVDAEGNIYIADPGNNRIRKVDTNGVISTIAGTGVELHGGDGGPAIEAQLCLPCCIELDSEENVYFIEGSNSWRVRKIDTNGMISTVAGVGMAGYGGDGGPAVSAALNYPTGIAFDKDGNMYIADTHNNSIRKVDRTTGIITTIAGFWGRQGYGGDGGPATSASLYYPTGVEVDEAGNVYIADSINLRIRKVGLDGIISTVAGNGGDPSGTTRDGVLATEATLMPPADVELGDSGYVYFVETNIDRVRRFRKYNCSPIADAGLDSSGWEGSLIALDGSGSTDADGLEDIVSYDWDFGDGDSDSGVSLSHSYDDNGVYTAALAVTDAAGETSSDSVLVTVNNVAPTAIFSAPTEVDEGGDFSLSLTEPFDPSTADTAAGFQYAFDCGAGYGSNDPVGSAVCSTEDNDVRTVRGRIHDKDGGESEYTGVTVVENVAPTVGSITAPLDPVQVGTSVTASADFTDPGALDTHTASWDWRDEGASPGMVAEEDGSGSVSGVHVYSIPGVYTIQLAVTDDDGGVGESMFQYVVVYDPDGGFVTGGGWINSPEGAYPADPTLAGKANFGFVSKYKKGAAVPTGQTAFQFTVADLSFHSDSYDWLVIAGARARYKGTGSINSEGSYSFMLTAIDGEMAGGGGSDKFRIKIWEKDTGTIIYDNQMGAADDADPATLIGGGSIVIHE